MWQELLKAFFETAYMTFASGAIGGVMGMILGTVLFITRKNGLNANVAVYQSLSLVVNAGRSLPFIILMIALIPFTRMIVGRSIGNEAAIVSLSIAAMPFVARLVENTFVKVDHGLIEAALSMGATRFQIIRHVLLPEARPGLIGDITVTLVNLVGYSAMAGTIGGGGLGSLAIHYGYQRFDTQVMIVTALILIVFVQLIQWIGDALYRHFDRR